MFVAKPDDLILVDRTRPGPCLRRVAEASQRMAGLEFGKDVWTRLLPRWVKVKPKL